MIRTTHIHVRRVICAVAFLCFAAMALPVVPQAEAAAPKGGATRIVSEKMTYDSAKNHVVFDGKVHVTRPDMEIWSEKLTLVLDNSGKKASSGSEGFGVEGGGKVKEIIAEKNVRIKQKDKTGTSGLATYYVDAGKIIMRQNPVLVDGANRIRGRVITYYTATGRSEVEGAVDVQFSTDDSKSPALPGVIPGETGEASDEEATQ